MTKHKLVLILSLIVFSCTAAFSQTIQGVVLDQKTQEPIESASVYFDNTTIGTSTNANGAFSIASVESITSPLIISFLGYQNVIISDYSTTKTYKILLVEDLNTLDQVVINADDGMPKAIKLQQFKKQFLGFSDNAKSCTILNEEDLILSYNAELNQLSASSRKPIIIKNNNLQYLVNFDIRDFEIIYHHVDLEFKRLSIKSVVYTGTSFYQLLKNTNSRKAIKLRDKTYKGSVLHFMRALSKQQLKDEGYQIFNNGFKVDPYKYITVIANDNSASVAVKLLKRLNILYKKRQSVIECMVDEFYIDQYGNHSPINQVLFGGDMGNQRIGDSLPFDYVYDDD